jgi:hypothetical protein
MADPIFEEMGQVGGVEGMLPGLMAAFLFSVMIGIFLLITMKRVAISKLLMPVR